MTTEVRRIEELEQEKEDYQLLQENKQREKEFQERQERQEKQEEKENKQQKQQKEDLERKNEFHITSDNTDTLDLTSKRLETFNAVNYGVYPKCDFSLLRILVLKDNRISTLIGMNLTKLGNLTDLDLSYNCLSGGVLSNGNNNGKNNENNNGNNKSNNIQNTKNISSFLPFSLLHLDISHNSLDNLEDLYALPSLLTLNASHNRLRHISAYPSSLRTLDLSNNLIHSIIDLRLLSLTPNITTLRIMDSPVSQHQSNPTTAGITASHNVISSSVTNPHSNSVSNNPLYRVTVCSVLPHLEHLDDLHIPGCNVRKKSGLPVHRDPGSFNNKDKYDNKNQAAATTAAAAAAAINKKAQEQGDTTRSASYALKQLEVAAEREEKNMNLLTLASSTAIDQETTDKLLKRLTLDSFDGPRSTPPESGPGSARRPVESGPGSGPGSVLGSGPSSGDKKGFLKRVGDKKEDKVELFSSFGSTRIPTLSRRERGRGGGGGGGERGGGGKGQKGAVSDTDMRDIQRDGDSGCVVTAADYDSAGES